MILLKQSNQQKPEIEFCKTFKLRLQVQQLSRLQGKLYSYQMGQIIIFQSISRKFCGAPSLIFLIFTYLHLHYVNRLDLQFQGSKCSGLEIIAF